MMKIFQTEDQPEIIRDRIFFGERSIDGFQPNQSFRVFTEVKHH